MFASIKRLAAFVCPALDSRPGLLQLVPPAAASGVKGFSISVTCKEGCVLRSGPKGSPDGAPYADAGVDEHFEVDVRYDGSNLDYPGSAKGPWTFRLTNTLKGAECGMIGGTVYEPPGSRFEKVEIAEKFEDHRNTEWLGSYYERPSPEYIVWMRITARRADGRESGFSVGLMTRPAHGFKFTEAS